MVLTTIFANCSQNITTRNIAGPDRDSIDSDGKYQEPENESLKYMHGCNICLEAFVEGDNCMHSTNPLLCPHVFHNVCILNWLISRPESLCPSCRQPFAILGVETPPSTCQEDSGQRLEYPSDDTETEL
jgi:hypothetical protein